MGCMMCGAVVEFPEFTDLCSSCEGSHLAAANTPLPCCGRPIDYCECPEWYSFRALMLATNARDNDTPRMADDDPRRDDEPPF